MRPDPAAVMIEDAREGVRESVRAEHSRGRSVLLRQSGVITLNNPPFHSNTFLGLNTTLY